MSYIQECRNRRAISQRENYRVLCIGESTTAPLTLTNDFSYPAQLQHILDSKNIGIKFSVINKGVVSITSSYVVANLENYLDYYKPDVVITMIGINDGGTSRLYIKPQKPGPIREFLWKFKTYKLSRLILMHSAKKLQTIITLFKTYFESKKIMPVHMRFHRHMDDFFENEATCLTKGLEFKEKKCFR